MVHVDAAEESSLKDLDRGDLRVPRHGPDDFDSHRSIAVTGLLRHPAARHDHFGIRNAIVKTFGVGIRQTVFPHRILVLAARLLFFGRLDRFDNHIPTAEPGDLLLCLAAGPFADGQHGNHGRDAEDNAQCRQSRTKLVHP